MKTPITEIKIKLAGREITLTPDEARAIRDQLNLLFGIEIHPFTYPVYQPQPVWVDPTIAPWPARWETTCGPENGVTVCCRMDNRASRV